jgi:chemotaxis protein MotB
MKESPTTTPPPRPDWLPWTLSVFGVGCAVFVLVKGVLPARSSNHQLSQQVAKLETRLAVAESTAVKEKQRQVELTEQYSTTKERLEKAIAERKAAVEERTAARKDLSESLRRQIAAGDVLVEEREGQLVIDVADKLLFDSGEAEVNKKGRMFLRKVAQSMKRLPATQVYQVGGHTDSQRVVSKQLVEQYPTNWELSTTRATNVTRFLEEEGEISGAQLVAAGFSQYRPASSNRTRSGRRKNRRIEIVLLRR